MEHLEASPAAVRKSFSGMATATQVIIIRGDDVEAATGLAELLFAFRSALPDADREPEPELPEFAQGTQCRHTGIPVTTTTIVIAIDASPLLILDS